MMKLEHKNIKILFLSLALGFLAGCSSVEYELEKTKVDYVEKNVVIDTILKTIDTTTQVTTEPKKDKFIFIVQIGAFLDKANFERFFEAAKAKLGGEVYYEYINMLYKIRVGKFNNRGDVLKFLEYVKSLGYFDAFIITVKQ